MSIPKTLTADQCQALIEELMPGFGTKKQIARGGRNGAMAIVMLETGIRVGELCGLRIDDLLYADQPVENLVVRKEIAKNNKERQIPISRKLAETIKMMVSVLWSPKKANAGSYAFFARTPANPLTTRSVERVILDAGKSASFRVWLAKAPAGSMKSDSFHILFSAGKASGEIWRAAKKRCHV